MGIPKLILKPNLKKAVLLNICIVLIIAIFIHVGFRYISYLAGFDVLGATFDTVNESFMMVHSSFLFVMAVGILEKLLTDFLTQTAILFVLIQLPTLNAEWKVYEDRLVYRTGSLFIKENSLPYSEILYVAGKKYNHLMEIGDIEIRLVGQKTIKIPFISGVTENASKIEFVLKNFRNRK